ncbi:MAG: PTS sugar transporter subunit IIA [Candidatus Hydrogenedentes bacterium]|nr:PTS sugar transporter subunit IIA [Candidatus Hydrogenedentota bacterium]
MSENRAESFLRLIRRAQRGRLKIYLGYSAGVGKTYEMLQEGHRLRNEGVDVVVGLVETHGREETEALLPGLEVIPRRRTTYRGIEIGEMDLDAVLQRRPTVVLVDELAHTNIPGSKNAKRYQDIEEILAAGIHVITTLNVQHVESLYDTVERFSGVKVRERVPDKVVMDADQIVNVDLTTEDLRERLKAGKVYTSERIDTALDGFFKAVNLEQLRELTLREVASQIDSRRRDAAEGESTTSLDQVMVCLSSRGPNTEMLLRYASRLAGRLNRNWYAVYVQTSWEAPTQIDAQTQRILTNNLSLARQLGATVFTYRGDDVVKTILQFAKEYRVGHIVLGAPARPASFWSRLTGRRSIIERLVSGCNGATVVVLDTRARHEAAPTKQPVKAISAAPTEPLLKLIAGNRILCWNQELSKEDALRQLVASCFGQKEAALSNEAWNAVMEREKQGSTFLSEDIAIPHARVQGLSSPRMSIGIAQHGILDTATGHRAAVVILYVSPLHEPDRHLRIMARIGALARNELVHAKLKSARKPREVYRVLQEWEESSGPSGRPRS